MHSPSSPGGVWCRRSRGRAGYFSPWLPLPRSNSCRRCLTPAEKRALDLLFDWPWITLGDLAGLLGVSPQRASQLLLRLEELDLASRTLIAGRRRLAVTDRGLALIARRDRASVGAVRKRWSAAPIEPLRVARLAQCVRFAQPAAPPQPGAHGGRPWLRRGSGAAGPGPWLGGGPTRPAPAGLKVLPARRGRFAPSNPMPSGSCAGASEPGPSSWEWERRAVRPVTMAARLAPYLRYYSSERPLEDHGAWPSVLVVFDDELAQVHFRRVAREEMERTGIEVPLRISHSAALDGCGPLEPKAWHRLGDSPTTDALGASDSLSARRTVVLGSLGSHVPTERGTRS